MKDIKDIKENLKNIKGFRLEHTLAVESTAVRVSKSYSVNLDKVRLAALLHDYARHFDKQKLIQHVKKNNIEVDEIEKEVPELLHSPVAAFLAKEKFKIKDNDVLNAIRYHTIGRPKMSLLEKIIFVADIIEPNREFPGVDLIRDVVKKDLDEAVILVCDFTIKYNIEKQKIIHPNTLFTRNSLLRGAK